jgi:DNA-binding MarR family transcriptional regulator
MSRKTAKKTAAAEDEAPASYVRSSDSIGGLVREVYRSMSRSLQTRILREGVSIGMWFVLRALWEEDGLTQREIGQRVSINGPTTVTQLNAMERAGFVRRVPNQQDRRKTNVFLTKEGKELKAKLWPMSEETNGLALRGISSAHTTLLCDILKQMLKNLENDRA